MYRLSRKPALLTVAAVTLALALSVPLDPLAHGGVAAASGRTVTFSGQVVNASAFSDVFFGPSGPPPGAAQFELDLFQSGTETNPRTMLYYNVCTLQRDPVNNWWNCVTVEGGFGLIPSSAVQSSGGARPTSVSLNVDTSTLSAPDFQLFAGAGGPISLTWKPVPGFASTDGGSRHDSSTFGGQSFSFSTAGSSYFTSAGAQGMLLGHAVPDPNAGYSSGTVGSMQGMSACRGC